MQSTEILIPWRSKNGYLTSDIVIEALNKTCKEKALQWKIGSDIKEMKTIDIRKIILTTNSITPIDTDSFKEDFKTSLHANCFLQVIDKVAVM